MPSTTGSSDRDSHDADGMTQRPSPIVGVILAGGLSRRMGAEKAFVSLAGRPLLAHAIGRLAPQVDRLILNANGDPGRFAAFGLPVVPDPVPGHAGPLAGILAGLLFARADLPGAREVAAIAVDTPFFPTDLVARLAAASDGARRIAVASSEGRLHPVFGAFPVDSAEDLMSFLNAGGRRVTDWLATRPVVAVAFPSSGPVGPFFNVNTPADLDAAGGSERLHIQDGE